MQRRIDNPKNIDHKLIESQLKEGNHVFIQFSDEVYSRKLLSTLNKLCSKYDKNFSIRFYGHYSKTFDCDILKNIPNVKSLYIDCIIKVKNLNQVSNLKNLESLSLGIYELEETEILDSKNFKNLTDLIIGDTKTKAFNLEYLQDYKRLKFLIISGHTKNIDKVKYLSNLTYLSLNSISKVKLDFINSLTNLKTLKIILGGRENLKEIEENNIEELEIIRVRGLSSFENISKFKKLKSLLIEDQIKLKELHFNRPFEYLKDFKLINCKSFIRLSGLINLKCLENLRIYKTNIDFDNFIKQPLPKSLNVLAFYTTKAKIDKEIKIRLQDLNYKEH
ncbi:hypothetical protein SAMN05660776_0632 [Salegentibacter holothuriorum]|uniref:Uncharacterized protein n=1 Tax=Salegentibacter holothuriorum TaxID=241145 RepID=A0A1T5AJS9_9FLAO|nr:hypothetical protein [Salegentibacter holothuriorum]SKB35135.1 hypothetical protein SAMN05660776_0632 [Salegentibacter holothuriorum]